ncbi:MAG: hypothetical protein ACI4SB_04600 [Acutalibacteraceae bacterium]
MIVNVGGYVFGYDEDTAEILCFKNRRIRYAIEAPDVLSREHFRRYCEKLIPILENVPDEYIDMCLDYEDLTEDFET